MLKLLRRKLAIGVTLAVLVTPVAFAGSSPTGTDPDRDRPAERGPGCPRALRISVKSFPSGFTITVAR